MSDTHEQQTKSAHGHASRHETEQSRGQRGHEGPQSDGASTKIARTAASGQAESLPHAGPLQQAFGSYDISGVKSHSGPASRQANAALGSHAFASGEHVVSEAPMDLRRSAHEATHVVQQRAGLTGAGLGRAGDANERQAERVADVVAGGHSAEPLLSEFTGGRGHEAHDSGQMAAVQRDEKKDGEKSDDKAASVTPVGNSWIVALDGRRTSFQGALDTNIASSVELKDKMESNPLAKGELEQMLEARMGIIRDFEAYLDTSIATLTGLLAQDPSMQSVLDAFNAERKKVAEGNAPLRRWEMRREIEAIDKQLEEMYTAPKTGTKPSEADEKKKAELLAQRDQLGAQISASMTDFKQYDSDYGKKAYGSDGRRNDMKENGCMPTAMAMVVNFYQQEQLENLAGGSSDNVYTPYDDSVQKKYEKTPEGEGRAEKTKEEIDKMTKDEKKEWKKKEYAGAYRKLKGDDGKFDEDDAKLSGAGLVQYGKGQTTRDDLKNEEGKGSEMGSVLSQLSKLFPGMDAKRIEKGDVMHSVLSGQPVVTSIVGGNGHIVVINQVSEDRESVMASNPGAEGALPIKISELETTCSYFFAIVPA